MKIERLTELDMDKITDELSYDADLCQNILLNASEELLSKLILERGSCYEISAIGGDATYYEWTDEMIDSTSSEEEAIQIAENAVNSGKWAGYTIVILQIPETIDDLEIDADTFEVWRYYVPEFDEYDIDDDTIEKFRESFNKFLNNARSNDCDDEEQIAWDWAVDVDDVEIPECFCDEDGNVEDEDELSGYLYSLALRFMEEQ